MLVPDEDRRKQQRDQEQDVIVTSPNMPDAFVQEGQQLLKLRRRRGQGDVEPRVHCAEDGLLRFTPILKTHDAAHLWIEREEDLRVERKARRMVGRALPSAPLQLTKAIRLKRQNERLAVRARLPLLVVHSQRKSLIVEPQHQPGNGVEAESFLAQAEVLRIGGKGISFI